MHIDLDALVPRLAVAAAERPFSGVLTIDVGDDRVLEQSHGMAHRALAVPNTPRHRFGIASGGKAFTALAVLRLVEDGVLTLDQPVRTVLGADLPLIDDAVTVEHLLSHTSGIGDYLDEEADWAPDDYVLSTPVHRLAETEAFLPELDGIPQKFPPGERFSYCNGGYVVLALVAERASGRPFHDLVVAEVCDRAGLADTRFLRSDELPGDAAIGYLNPEGDRSNVLHLPVRGNGDGGIFTSAADLHRFWSALHAGDIVRPATAEAMLRPRIDVPGEGARYGLGFWVHPTRPHPRLVGGDAGVSFFSTHDPATRTTVSVLGNTSNGAWPVVRALTAFLDAEA